MRYYSHPCVFGQENHQASIEQIALNYPELTAPLCGRRRRLGRDRLQRGFDKIGDRPHALSNPERHSRRHPQCFMRAAEIVERDVQAHGGQVAIDLFAKAIAQSREPLRSHAQCEVLPDTRCRKN